MSDWILAAEIFDSNGKMVANVSVRKDGDDWLIRTREHERSFKDAHEVSGILCKHFGGMAAKVKEAARRVPVVAGLMTTQLYAKCSHCAHYEPMSIVRARSVSNPDSVLFEIECCQCGDRFKVPNLEDFEREQVERIFFYPGPLPKH